MKINHVALYCLDLERMKDFFIRYFNGVSNEMYHNPKTRLKTYILSFPDSDARLELMTRPEVKDTEENRRNRQTLWGGCTAANPKLLPNDT